VLPTIITTCVVTVCVATAAYVLIHLAAWIAHLFDRKPKSDDRRQGPPDLSQGF
jgi:hypothetical protein